VSSSVFRPYQRHGHELPACYAPASYPPCTATPAPCSPSRSVDRRADRSGGSALVRLPLLIPLSLSSLSRRCSASPPDEARPWRPSGHGSLLFSHLHIAHDCCLHLHLAVRCRLDSSSCGHRAGSHTLVSSLRPTPAQLCLAVRRRREVSFIYPGLPFIYPLRAAYLSCTQFTCCRACRHASSARCSAHRARSRRSFASSCARRASSSHLVCMLFRT
jgi:hypothetical protein